MLRKSGSRFDGLSNAFAAPGRRVCGFLLVSLLVLRYMDANTLPGETFPTRSKKNSTESWLPDWDAARAKQGALSTSANWSWNFVSDRSGSEVSLLSVQLIAFFTSPITK
jgi:hypothetical protein